jgi:8-oxo-dGTP diphosphatase
MKKPPAPIIQGANILLTNGNSLLLQLRDNKSTISYPNHWALPGGKRESTETPEENAIRELQEECGYTMTHPRLVLRKIVTKDNGVTVEEFVFTEDYDGIQEIKCLEGQAIQFIPLNEICDLSLVPWQREIIEEVMHQGAL